MFNFEIKRGYSNGNLASLLQDCLISPEKATNSVAKFKAGIDNAKNAALRMTAARLRKRMLEAFDNNSLKWPEHTEYSNWLNLDMPVPIAPLAAANRPIKATTKSGKARKRGYSQQRYIRPPQVRRLGGKYRNMMRYSIDIKASNFKVGMLDDFAGSTWGRNFRKFQEGGTWQPHGDPIRTQHYMGALGIYLRKYPIFKMPKRPLIKPIERQYPPDKLYKEAFEQKLEGKA